MEKSDYMERTDLPNFPLLFKQIGHFLIEAHPVKPELAEDYRRACEAFNLIVQVIYPGKVGVCNSQPRVPMR